jgi:hypothetical protein
MKRYAALFLTIVIATSSFAAGPVAQAASTGVKKTRKSSAATKATSNVAADLAEMKALLQQQQQEINQLQQQLQQRDQSLQATQQQVTELQSAANQAKTSAAEAQATASSLRNSSASDKESLTKLSSDVKDIQSNMTTAALQSQEDQKRVSAVEGFLGRFRMSGDIRLRQEDFFGSGAGSCAAGQNCNPRARERVRLRFGIDGKLGEDFVGGIALASGVLTDPTSTNDTLTSNFEKKTIGFDRGYITFNPHNAKWMSLTGGKFAATWIKTPQTFDNDLNPEGFSEKFSFDKGSPLLKNLTFTGIQLLYNEANRPAGAATCIVGIGACTGGGSFTGGDSFAAGGQVSAKLQLTKRWSIIPSYMILNWRNNDVILNESATVTGGSAGVFAPNGMTNATVTTTSGGVTVTQFWSKFLYSDVILDNNIATGWKFLPNWRILGEYLDNLNAQDHPLIAGTNAVATDLGSQSHLYRIETTLGQQKAKGDWAFTYSFHRQEQDSVIASFVESDQRAPTNIIQHTFTVAYKIRNNTALSYTQWIGRTLNSNLQNRALGPGFTTGQQEDFLKRMQFEVVYSF